MFQEKIFDGTDRATELKVADYISLIHWQFRNQIKSWTNAQRFELIEKYSGWNGQIDTEYEPIQAYINGGRWLGRCAFCKGIEYVSKSTPIFFCHQCDNERISNKACTVLFPSNMIEIEKELLKRPLKMPVHLENKITKIDNTQLAAAALPVSAGLRIDWYPHNSSLEEIKQINLMAGIQ